MEKSYLGHTTFPASHIRNASRVFQLLLSVTVVDVLFVLVFTLPFFLNTFLVSYSVIPLDIIVLTQERCCFTT